MSFFNKKSVQQQKTTNLAGGNAFALDKKTHLVFLLCTTFAQEKYHQSADWEMGDLQKLVEEIPDKKFIAKAILFARNDFGMRSISHAAASFLARHASGKDWGEDFYHHIVRRPDDLTEILAHYFTHSGKKITNAMRRGFARALEEMDAHHLAKYRGKDKGISLIDAVRLVHPKSTDALKALVYNTLPSAETWEVGLTKAGQEAQDDDEKVEKKNAVWAELIASGKIGYLALLRNIRNILETDDDTITKAFALLQDEARIKNSLVMPFRFLNALQAIAETNDGRSRDAMAAISNACDISCANVPKMPGKTLVVLDCSGSMQGMPMTIGSLFAAVLYKTNDADLMLFSDEAVYTTLNPAAPITSLHQEILQRCFVGGTNFNAIFSTANRPYDRIIILSDMQGWIGGGAPLATWEAYKQTAQCNPKIYSFDLTGHGTLQFPQDQVVALAGWSDKVFDVMRALEEDRHAMTKKVEAIEL